MKLLCTMYFLIQLIFPVYVVVICWTGLNNMNVSICTTVLAILSLIPNLMILVVALSGEEHKNED